MAGSKNNPENRGQAAKTRIALSSDCESCKERCPGGISYLSGLDNPERRFRSGKGVNCPR